MSFVHSFIHSFILSFYQLALVNLIHMISMTTTKNPFPRIGIYNRVLALLYYNYDNNIQLIFCIDAKSCCGAKASRTNWPMPGSTTTHHSDGWFTNINNNTSQQRQWKNRNACGGKSLIIVSLQFLALTKWQQIIWLLLSDCQNISLQCFKFCFIFLTLVLILDSIFFQICLKKGMRHFIKTRHFRFKLCDVII